MRKLNKLIEYLFYLYLFLLPWQTRLIIKEGILNNGHWEWGTYSLYATDIVFILLLVLFCFNLLTNSSISNSQFLISKQIQNPKPSKTFKFQLLVIIFLLFVFLSVFWAKDSGLAFYWALRICQGVILFFLIKKIDFSFLKAGFSLVFAGLIQVFLGLSQFINQRVFASKWLGIAAQDSSQSGVSVVETAEGRILRVYGSLPHPNVLAGFLVFVILISFILYLLVKKSWIRYFVLFSASLMTIILFLTYSRAAWLSLIISIFFIAFFIFKKNYVNLRTSFFEFFGLILIITLIFSGLSLRDLIVRVEVRGKLENRSVNERIFNFQRSLEIIRDNFPFGVGIGNYTLALYQKYSNLSSWDAQPVASIYFLILSELGIIGLILFFLIIVFSLKFRVYSLLLMSLLIIGFFDHWLFSLPFGILLFWLAIGCCGKIKNNFLV